MTAMWAVLAKGGTLVVALVCGVVTTRLITSQAGTGAFAVYTLLTALPALLIFLDLGSGAAVVNRVATSSDPRHDDELLRTVTTVWRIILGFAVVTLVVDVVLLVTGAWTAILGEAGRLPNSSLAAATCLATFCLSIALAIWQRLLLGLQRNHVIVLVQGIQSPINLLLVWLLLHDQRLAAFLAMGAFVAGLVVGLVGFRIAHRLTAPLLPNARARLLRLRRYPNARVMDVGWPMMAQVLASPLAITLQRYLLAHEGTEQQVAEYGVLGQVFFAVLGMVSAAGLALWPAYTRARHEGRLRRGPYLLAGAFGGGVLVATAVIWSVEDWLFAFITHGTIAVASVDVLLFGVMVAVQAALYPLGMFIMDREGLRFQVVPVALMVVSTITLTLVLTPSLGVGGPLVASAASALVFQIVPFCGYIHRHRRRLLGLDGGPVEASSPSRIA